MLDLENNPELHSLLETFVGGMNLHQIDLGIIFEALVGMRAKFALPQDWRQLRKYFRQAIRIASKKRSHKLDAFGQQWGVPIRTLYRWIEDLKRERGLLGKWMELTDEDWESFRERAKERIIRQEGKRILRDQGMNNEAARKYLQRKSKRMSLEKVVSELRKGIKP